MHCTPAPSPTGREPSQRGGNAMQDHFGAGGTGGGPGETGRTQGLGDGSPSLGQSGAGGQSGTGMGSSSAGSSGGSLGSSGGAGGLGGSGGLGSSGLGGSSGVGSG